MQHPGTDSPSPPPCCTVANPLIFVANDHTGSLASRIVTRSCVGVNKLFFLHIMSLKMENGSETYKILLALPYIIMEIFYFISDLRL